jgi:hypothetical protein
MIDAEPRCYRGPDDLPASIPAVERGDFDLIYWNSDMMHLEDDSVTRSAFDDMGAVADLSLADDVRCEAWGRLKVATGYAPRDAETRPS